MRTRRRSASHTDALAAALAALAILDTEEVDHCPIVGCTLCDSVARAAA